MIPKQFHRVWIGSASIPQVHRKWMADWQRLHPGWSARLWNDISCRKIISEVAPSLLPLYVAAKSPAGKSDLARYCIVYKHGGVYLDTDFRPLRPIGELLSGCDGFVHVARERQGIGNALFGFTPEHPFLAEVISAIPSLFDPKRPSKTGPLLFTSIARHRSDVRVFEQRIFVPIPSDRRSEIDLEADYPGSYAVHHFAASWL